jgi:hypothetical protein
MKIVISNLEFPYDMGCRLLKLKYKECPFEEIADIWDDIVPMTFKEIAKLPNLEQRRVGVLCLGLEKLYKEVQPKLVDKQTLKKSTMWVDEKGELKEVKFDDTYELYEVNGKYFNEGLENNWQKMANAYFIKCKDTSTDRFYFIWIEPKQVYITNNPTDTYGYKFEVKKINAIQSIAWTIQTDIPQGKIEKIVRQGDCILIKPKGNFEPLKAPRHLTEKEYKTLLVAES